MRGLAALGSALAMAATPAVGEAEPDASTTRSAIMTVVSDADDTAGRLDLARVRVRAAPREQRGTRVTYLLRTFQRFRDDSLSRRNRHFVLELDGDDERGSERNITIYARDGDLVADLISNATREVIAHLQVLRRDTTSIAVRGSADLIGVRRLFAVSNFHRTGERPCGWSAGWSITCQDEVPDRGWLRLDRSVWP